MKSIKQLPLWLKAIALLFAICTFGSCDDGSDCSMNNTSYNRVRLYSVNPITGKESVATYNGQLSVALMIEGRDSIVINRLTSASELTIPVSYAQQRDTVVLIYDNMYTDTLYVEHTNTPYFISLSCGTGMFHNLTGLQHTQSFIDSAVIVNHTINYDPNENIKLYIAQ